MTSTESRFNRPKSDKLSVLTVSDMCVDLVVTGNVRPQFHQVEQIVGDYAIELGGSANVFASQLAKLGQRVGVIGYVGQDQFGEFAFQQLREAGVDTSHVKRHPTLKTGLGLALTEPTDRAMLTYMGTIDATQPADLKEDLLDSCRHWHFASIFLLRNLRGLWGDWLRKCREAKVTISMDPNWDPDNRWEGVTELLPLIDVFLPNEAEARALTGETDVWKAAKLLAAQGPLVVVKCGENGAIAVDGDQTWQIKGSEGQESPLSVVDTTGAGDNFDAGFLRGWLLGNSNDFSLQLGHRCALGSLGYAGGIRGQLKQMIEAKQ
ncbi:MAG TPA: carbohydrate kinase family protein [Terriglobales bacterium]|jgi:sugar/nucleoside kinase (ribokinase family)|nr:carbohydrate kinase family protein [Terriglobales bacterium]